MAISFDTAMVPYGMWFVNRNVAFYPHIEARQTIGPKQERLPPQQLFAGFYRRE
jgi:hypothetical protein